MFLPCGHTPGPLAARAVALLAGAVAALGGPVAQLLWLQEVAPAQAAQGRASAPQYRVVWAGDWAAQDHGRQPAAGTQPAKARGRQPAGRSPEQKPPRLLKPLADHWEAASRVHIDSSAIPPPAVQTEGPKCRDVAAHERPMLLCLPYDPPSPPARGPPATL